MENHSPPLLTAGLGRAWETLNVGFKTAPVSNGSITAMHTLNRIMRDHSLSAHDIEHIIASVSTNTLEHCGWHFDPAQVKGVLAAQMNLRYGLAVMALDAVATPDQFAESRIRSADVADFLPRIEVRNWSAFDEDPALRLACRLEVRTRGGKTYRDETLYRPGSAEDPISAEALEAKFMTLTATVLLPAQAAQCVDHIKILEQHTCIAILS